MERVKLVIGDEVEERIVSDKQGAIIDNILSMRALLYANIIGYDEYQAFVKKVFSLNDLKYRFTEMKTTLSGYEYGHIGSCREYAVAIHIAPRFVEFDMEEF